MPAPAAATPSATGHARAVDLYALLHSSKGLLLLEEAGNDGERRLAPPCASLRQGESVAPGALCGPLEALGVQVAVHDLVFAHCFSQRTPDGEPSLALCYTVRRWSGVPTISGSRLYTGLQWAQLSGLPEPTAVFFGGWSEQTVLAGDGSAR